MTNAILLGHYDWRLVALSLAIAICASYCALDLAGRTANSTGRSRRNWLGGGALALGLGIWAMHYVGMLAFHLPVAVLYDLPTVALSLLAAIVSSAIALSAVSGRELSRPRWLIGAVFMAAGICAMRYSGMFAMRLAARPVYDVRIVCLSVLIALVVSLLALRIAFRLRDSSPSRIDLKLSSAVLMGGAIAAMHYTGMAAVCFHQVNGTGHTAHSVSVSSLGIFGISLVTFLVLALVLVGALTDRRFSRQRDLLLAEQERWAIVLEATHDGLFDADLTRGTVVESRRWREMLGYAPGEFPVTSPGWLARIHPDDRAAVEKDLADYLSRRVPRLDVEYRLAHHDGTWRWLLLRAQAVWDAAGNPVRLIGSHSDITDRKRAEAQLRANEARYREELESLVRQRTFELKKSETRWRSLVEATPQFVWSALANGDCDYLSHQWVEYTGVPLAEQLGSGWVHLLHPDDQQRVRQAWQTAVESGSPSQAEYRLRSHDGRYRWFLARGIPVRNIAGEVDSWLGTSSDIDDQKRSEERLEAAVVERTAELAVARDRAESAARAKSEFLASMSHEIRTPMNGILGLTSLLLETRLDSEQQAYLDGIRSSGQALLGIINDILDFSKLEAGKLGVEQSQFDLQTLVEEAIEVLSYSASGKNIHLSFHIDPAVPLDVIGDPGRLRQVLLNLLSNAVKFTEQGSVVLNLAPGAGQHGSPSCRFSIQDTGIGITPEQQKSLFQAFSQADPSTTRRFGGTGLGLSIAKRLTELMRGTIGVNSNFGKGSTFWFELPLVPHHDDRWQALSNGTAWLLAGDALPLSAIQLAYLQRYGMHVTGVAPAACNTSGETLPDILLVDSSDAVACKTLAAFPASHPLAGVPVVALGSLQEVAAKELPPHFNPCAWVPKPVRRLPLLAAAASAIAGHRLPIPFHTNRLPAKVLCLSRVLVAEDNRINQIVIRKLLEGLGHAVDIVEDGAQACAAAERTRYDLILMDCQMPVMDGFEATARIRESEAGKWRVPIIALTASVLDQERDRCYQAGMDDFVAKPISKPALNAALDRWLRNRSAA